MEINPQNSNYSGQDTSSLNKQSNRNKYLLVILLFILVGLGIYFSKIYQLIGTKTSPSYTWGKIQINPIPVGNKMQRLDYLVKETKYLPIEASPEFFFSTRSESIDNFPNSQVFRGTLREKNEHTITLEILTGKIVFTLKDGSSAATSTVYRLRENLSTGKGRFIPKTEFLALDNNQAAIVYADTKTSEAFGIELFQPKK